MLRNQYSTLKSLVERNGKMEYKNKIRFPCIGVIHESGHKAWGLCKKKPQFCIKVKKLIKIEGDLDFICRLKGAPLEKDQDQERKMRSKSKFNKFS